MIPVLSEPAELRDGTAANDASMATTASNAKTIKRLFGCLTFIPSEQIQSLPLLSANDGRTFSYSGQESCRFGAQSLDEIRIRDRFQINGDVFERASSRGTGHQTSDAKV